MSYIKITLINLTDYKVEQKEQEKSIQVGGIDIIINEIVQTPVLSYILFDFYEQKEFPNALRLECDYCNCSLELNNNVIIVITTNIKQYNKEINLVLYDSYLKKNILRELLIFDYMDKNTENEDYINYMYRFK